MALKNCSSASSISDLTVFGKNPMEHFLGLERRQHRFKGVIHRQHMGDAAAGGHGQHHFVSQGPFRQQVQHGLQRAGKRRLVHRRGDYQAVSVFDLLEQVDNLRAVETGMEQIFGWEIAHLIAHHLHTLLLQPTLRALQQHPGAGALAGTATE
jgi:hypothetical protein